jgi:hypothetical protein
MPPIHEKSGSSTRRWQTCEIVLNRKVLLTKEAREAKEQVPEHYRKQLLKGQKRVEEATKVSGRTVRRILERKKHEAQGTSFS